MFGFVISLFPIDLFENLMPINGTPRELQGNGLNWTNFLRSVKIVPIIVMAQNGDIKEAKIFALNI